MDEFKKDNNLMSGKGENDVEWITVNGSHIPIKEGETPKEAIKKRFENGGGKNEGQGLKEIASSGEYNESINKLVDVLKQVKKVKTKELVNYIKSMQPVSLQINDDEIIAQFDKFSATKNIFGHGRSDEEGYKYKLNNLKELPQMIKDSKYQYSKEETGKNTLQHRGVKEWHYFVNEIATEKGDFNVTVNIRDKGENKYVYEVAIRRKKT